MADTVGYRSSLGFIYGTAWKKDDTKRCVLEALDAGFRAIDTANQPKHYYEPGIGDALDEVYARGRIDRGQLFLQTKFTPLGGQGATTPYDREAPVSTQVEQSFASSLKNLRTSRIDSYVLHGPSDPYRLTDGDWEAWRAMEALYQRGDVRHLGVSNVSLEHLAELVDQAAVTPGFVQNRCFARTGWDRHMREYCHDQGIVYQGFSLLTANLQVIRDARFAEIVSRTGLTPAQVVFGFARQVGILPLTGTTDRAHMDEDLRSLELELPTNDVKTIESLALG